MNRTKLMLVFSLILIGGCKTTTGLEDKEIVYVPTQVKVPVAIQGQPIVFPERPRFQKTTTDDGRDIARNAQINFELLKEYTIKLEDLIRAHNKALKPSAGPVPIGGITSDDTN